MKLNIPSKIKMAKITATDPNQQIFCVERYYSFPFNQFYLKRFKIVLNLLGKNKCEKLLDIGFGSGIFLPSLSLRTKKLFGLDNHNYVPQVSNFLSDLKIEAEIKKGSVVALPYEDNQFDCVICLSVLEFVEDIDKAMSEIVRVAKSGAKIIIGAPVVSKFTDACYAILGKKGQNKIHQSNHKKIINSAKKYFSMEKVKIIPFFLPLDYSLFFIFSAQKK